MEILLKYRFFVLMAICLVLQVYYGGNSDLATIVFFVAILDLSNVMSKKKIKNNPHNSGVFCFKQKTLC